MHYDEAVDRAMREDFARFKFIRDNRPLYKNELSDHKRNEQNKMRRAKAAKMSAAEIAATEQAEAALADAIREVVSALEFHITALQEHPIPRGNYKRAVRRMPVMEVIYDLKTKCGVAFDPSGDFMHRGTFVDPDIRKRIPYGGVAPKPVEDEFQKLTTQVLRRERERKEVMAQRKEAMRLIAEKFAKRKRGEKL
jgi:hypothetical protein